MIEFITTHWIAILIVLAVVAFVVFLAVRGKKDIIYKMLYALCDEAEKIYGSKTGKLKFAYVMEKAYAMLPAIIKAFITYSMLEKWIEKAFTKWKADLAEKIEDIEEAEIAE